MKQEIMIGAPRMYKGFFKNIWNSLDGKEDPPAAVAVPIKDEGTEPEEKLVDVPLNLCHHKRRTRTSSKQ